MLTSCRHCEQVLFYLFILFFLFLNVGKIHKGICFYSFMVKWELTTPKTNKKERRSPSISGNWRKAGAKPQKNSSLTKLKDKYKYGAPPNRVKRSPASKSHCADNHSAPSLFPSVARPYRVSPHSPFICRWLCVCVQLWSKNKKKINKIKKKGDWNLNVDGTSFTRMRSSKPNVRMSQVFF